MSEDIKKEQIPSQIEKDLTESIFGKPQVIRNLSAEIFGDVTKIPEPTDGHSTILDTSMSLVDGKPVRKIAPVKEDSII